MTNKSTDLLIEILKLVYSYGPEEFDTLARELNSAQFKGNLPHLLEDVAREVRRTERHLSKNQQARHTLLTQRSNRSKLLDQELENSRPMRTNSTTLEHQQSSPRKSPSKRTSSIIEAYRTSDPEKYRLLQILHDNLRIRKLKPSEQSALARSLGLLDTGGTRKELTERIIKRLSTRNQRELQEVIAEWFESNEFGGDLAGWSKIILPKNKKFE